MTKIVFPQDWTTDEWYGFRRHHFTVDGCHAWIAEPEYPVPDGRWTWCAQWAEAFVPRVGTVAYLEHGFHHGHVDVHQFHGSPKAMEVMSHFQDIAVQLGLASQVSLLGLSWGGFYSLRYSQTFPQRVRSLYLDAPVCNAADPSPRAAERLQQIQEQWNMSVQELASSPLNPLNGVAKLVEAKIPVFAVIGEADNVVLPELNFNLIEKEFQKCGTPIIQLKNEADPCIKNVAPGQVYVLRRVPYAHHPHGLDNVTPLLQFHWNVW